MARPYKAEERKKIKEEFLKAYEDSMGLQYASCRRAGVTVDTINAWRKKDPEFDAAISEIDHHRDELVVGELMNAIQNHNLSAIIFYCKTRLGFSEKSQLELSSKGDIDVEAAIKEMKKDLENNGQ